MTVKSQSLFLKLSRRFKIKAQVNSAYSDFKKECGFSPALSEELFFKTCCASVIEENGSLPEIYLIYLCLRLRAERKSLFIPNEFRRGIH